MASPVRGAGRPWRGKRTARRPPHYAGDGGGDSRRRGGARKQHGSPAQRPPRVFPNFFVGVRVRSAQVVAHVERLQEAIRAELPEVSPCLIDPQTLHVTLCVVRLPDDRAIADASEVLRSETRRFLAQNDEPLALEFSHWGVFGRNDVVFASTEPAQWLETLAESLHGALERLDFTTEAFRRPYTPHLTVWKTSKDRNLIKALNACRPPSAPVQDALSRVLLACDLPGGVDAPASVELLSIREREQDGYYRAYASQNLSAQ